MSVTYQMIAATDIGQVRTANEDSLRIIPSINLAVVADGMGGHKAGDVASRMAVSSISEYFEEQANIREVIGGELSLDVMADAFSMANSLVYANAQQMVNCDGMGTTLLAGCFQPDKIHIGHIGDSRFYTFTRGDLEQVTRDHTLANELDSENTSWELPAYSHHVLRKALGIESACSPDFITIEPEPGQMYLMCSDGLSGVVGEQDMATILPLRSNNPEYCMETLISACLNGGAPDNVSAILVIASQS